MSVVDELLNLELSGDSPETLALDKAEQVLKAHPDNEMALHTKLVALVRSDRYKQAADVLKTLPVEKFTSEAAYIYYQTNNLKGIQSLAQQHPNATSVQLSLAQALYRAGNYTAALNILSKVSVSADLDADLAVNLGAISAASGQLKDSNLETSEFGHIFNAAYAHTKRKSFEKALELLSQAKQQAQDEEETASCVILAAFIKHKLGQVTDASDILESVQAPSKDLDLLVANNKIALHPNLQLEEALKALGTFDGYDFINATTFVGTQKIQLAANRALLQAKAGHSIHKAAKRYTRLGSMAPAVLDAFQASKGGNIDLLRKLRSRRPLEVPVSFVLAQQLVNEKNDYRAAATEILRLYNALFANRVDISPAVIGAALAALRILDKEPIHLATELLKSVDLSGDMSIPASVVAQSENEQDRIKAGLYFASLEDEQLRAAGACASQPEQVQYGDASSYLPPVDELTRGLDAHDLENFGFEILFGSKRRPTGLPKKRKRHSKPRLPKEYDESKVPDPERWLPKMSRSAYKKKKKGGASQGAGATQGSATAKPLSNAAPVVAKGVVKPKGASSKAKKKKGKK